MGERYFYIDEWCDETMPCVPTLEGWAEWMAKPCGHEDVVDWREDEIADGAEFIASTMDVQPDIVARRVATGWECSAAVPGDFFAVRYGRGMGWDAERSAASLATLLECEDENGGDDEELIIAVAKDGPSYRFRFQRSPRGAHLMVIGTVN